MLCCVLNIKSVEYPTAPLPLGSRQLQLRFPRRHTRKHEVLSENEFDQFQHGAKVDALVMIQRPMTICQGGACRGRNGLKGRNNELVPR